MFTIKELMLYISVVALGTTACIRATSKTLNAGSVYNFPELFLGVFLIAFSIVALIGRVSGLSIRVSSVLAVGSAFCFAVIGILFVI